MEQKDSQLRDSLTISPRLNRQREATIALMWNLFPQFLCYFHYDLLCYTDHPDLHKIVEEMSGTMISRNVSHRLWVDFGFW